ncbi:U3 small nucleolar ribonucleoprotein complex subunit Mpp10p [Penicillium angulare]|uniref:U3 small nucleolar ribonucleoprotein complex subunit Mpp10p n=1 Tax=Penicillium angulare TaxID=116970 RepID=UPI002541C0F6|nr:U3 small nucleolar ribonucleoprotein complex subunit Mpp10p [Penicillium angulare]KAJ5281352.1 U3 small nucleolar ribonucleoprotein complex subunit Mpp10p [Penicillium angulare]
MGRRKSGNKPQASTTPALPSILSTPWTFLQPTDDLHTLIADSTKQILDPLAASVIEEQSLRRQANKKRKRSDDDDALPPLQLKNLYVDGFTSNQVWEQATRILEAAGSEIERDVNLMIQHDEQLSSEDDSDSLDASDLEGLESGSDDDDMSNDDLEDGSVDVDGMKELEDSELDEDEPEDVEAMDEDLDEDIEDIEDIEKDDDEEASQASEEDPGVYVEDRFGLNDGFFSIDDFNKQTEAWEREDANGNNVDDDSDDDLDWHANPLSAGAAKSDTKKDRSSKTKETKEESDDMEIDDSEEEGPTFGDADLYGDSDSDEGAADEDEEEGPAWQDTSDIKYADFFAPPPRKASSKNKFRPLPKTQAPEPIEDDDVDRAMADVRRDIFDDESDIEAEEDVDETGNAQGPKSSHEKERARIADEIRKLENANVAKKEWMLTGEARAVERPINSLIEEDMDFERIGKPVPVVTNETSEDIEELIKRRILAQEFDEVIRRRPGAVDTKGPRSSRFELEDTKPQQSLAEMYEADHLRANDPNYVDTKDKKLARDHAEVNNLWKEISSSLDTLSNWHYKPQAPQANINVVTDAPTIMMEDARPTAGSAADGPSALAPQEVYAPGDDGKVAGEVVRKSGAAVSKEEMSREEKARSRRQRKKQGANSEATVKKGKAGEKQQLVSDLKKGGVRLVNKEGKVTDMEGARVGEATKNSGDFLKL